MHFLVSTKLPPTVNAGWLINRKMLLKISEPKTNNLDAGFWAIVVVVTLKFGIFDNHNGYS